MSITADGWISFATRDPGPAHKHYDVDNERRGIIAHSMEGKYVDARSRLFGPDRASWTGSILYSGELIEHYPVTYSVWASGSAEANVGFPAFETEGNQYEPFNDAQIATWARIIADLSAWAGWTPLRPVYPLVYGDPATCIEHRECKVLFDSAPTACPSERADWPRMMRMEESMFVRLNGSAGYWPGMVYQIGTGSFMDLRRDFPALPPGAKLVALDVRIDPATNGALVIKDGSGAYADALNKRKSEAIVNVIPGADGRIYFDILTAPVLFAHVGIVGYWV